MLRSLVGSEMCIRDRAARTGQADLVGGVEHAGAVAQQGAGMIEGERLHCLLYTSDAADDLLCVDLGGRRIIKKKKHTHTHTHTNRPQD